MTSNLPGALLAIIYTILGGAIIGILQQAASLNIVNSFAGLQIALLVVLALFIYMVHGIESRLDDLYRRSKLVVDYYVNSEAGFVAAKRIVEGLKEGASVRVVNSFVEADTPGIPSRQVWYTAIEAALGTIHYHRIVQLPASDVMAVGRRALHQFISSSYLDHFRDTLLIRNRLQNPRYLTRIDAVPARYPITFVIIQNPGSEPGGILIVSINQYVRTDVNNVVWTMAGSFVISDPDGQLVPHFESLYNSLANADGLRAITLDELHTPDGADRAATTVS